MSAPRNGTWDAIVIGAGVNGLVAAHYLARGGKRVLVVEQRSQPDTALETGWLPPVIARELGVGNGTVAVPADPWISAPLPAGGRLDLVRDVARSAEAIRRISPADAAKWPEFCARMHRLAGVLERLYLRPPPDIETRAFGELLGLAGLGLHVRRLGRQAIIDLARIIPMSIAELLDDWFENDVLKGLLGALGIWHLKQGPRAGGTAFNFLHHHVGSAPGVFRPGRSDVAQTLAGAQRPGVVIRRGSGRSRIVTAGGRVSGIALEPSGETLLAPLVVSSADPRAALRDVAGELDPEFVRAVDNIKCRGVVARGTLQLDRPVDYSARCLAPSLDYLERAYDAAKYGRDSDEPYVEATVAGDGGQTRLDLHVQYVPYRDGIANLERHQALQRRVAGLLNAQPSQVRLETPDEREIREGLTEGHLYHGELTLDQILFMRPVPGWSRYRTPLEGLYLCGPGTHPGGGILGASGRNAARAILSS
jgi:phytoene dehydrogenase-like protein